MPTPAPAQPSLSADLTHRVEAFELALDIRPEADLAAHLPPAGHPLYLAVLGELVRIDMERAWADGRPKRIADYAARFPAILANDTVLAAVAFEEYRQRVRAGEGAQPDEYHHRYGVNTAGWGDFGPESAGRPPADGEPPPTHVLTPPRDGVRTAAIPVVPPTHNRLAAQTPRKARAKALSDAEAVSHWQEATASLPKVGTEFVGFYLVEELGRGAFGRVYLARQGDLAGRPVALKVAAGLDAESNTLAQLQHANIVPIYSYHAAGPFQAVCMPFLGGTTLAQVVRSLSAMPGVPSSGRELRSTLQRGRLDTAAQSSTAPDVGSTPGADSAVADPLAAAPSGAEYDGWARLDGLPFVDAVLALVGQLADGLAHAHRRGILHRDLKPANVLLTDDGRPMLLDFNLAEDTKLRGSVERALVGGTLPYMSPEQMHAFRSASGVLDARTDIYSLGVILFELLTGKHPFPVHKGHPRQTIPLMIADRATPPRVREYNPAVSPGVEALVLKCLAPDPAARYPSAEALREDIDRHLAHRPLKWAGNPSARERAAKWARRHPRLASSFTVAAVALVVLAATVGAGLYARERTRTLEARGRYADHQTAFRDAQSFLDDQTRSRAQLDAGLDKLNGVLAGYGIPPDGSGTDDWQSATVFSRLPDADRERVTGDVGETFFLMAQVALLRAAAADPGDRETHLANAERWNARAAKYGTSRLPRAVAEQKAAIAESRDRAAADRARAEAELIAVTSARDLYLAGSQHARAGRHREALKYLQPSTQRDPENYSAWFLRGLSHAAIGQDELAVMCLGACVALNQEFAPGWLNRGLALARMRLYADARGDFDRACTVDPKLTEAYLQRAELKLRDGDRDGAIEDYTRALATGTAPARVYFKRAVAKEEKGDAAGAKADRAAGFAAPATDPLSWLARSENRGDDLPAALADVEQALKLDPWSADALLMKSALLTESHREAEAVAVLDKAVELYPDAAALRAGRGVLLARAGKRDAALRDAQDALRRDTRAPNLYQVGCIYALTAKAHPDDRREAIKLLWDGLKTGFALDLVDTDHDLDALRDGQDFKDMVREAKELDALRRRAK